jgi:ribokinase
LRDKKLDFIGFGALNMDVFYRLQYKKRVDEIISGLQSGGEIIGKENQREKLLKSINNNAEVTGRSGGGQAANTSVALARMGFNCGFLGKVGDDEMGDKLLTDMENVDKSHIQRGGNSGACLCILDQSSERSNIVFPGCNDTLSLSEDDLNYIRSSRILHITSFCSEKMLDLQIWLLEQDLGEIIITFDPGEIYSRLGLKRLRKIFSSTYALFATEDELKLITDEKTEKAADMIIQCGTKIVICKRSQRGSYIISHEDNIHIPAEKVEKVVDKTGAGDVYAAGFIAGLLLSLPLHICGKLGSKTAAISISGYGREKYPDSSFLANFLREIGEYNRV